MPSWPYWRPHLIHGFVVGCDSVDDIVLHSSVWFRPMGNFVFSYQFLVLVDDVLNLVFVPLEVRSIVDIGIVDLKSLLHRAPYIDANDHGYFRHDCTAKTTVGALRTAAAAALAVARDAVTLTIDGAAVDDSQSAEEARLFERMSRLKVLVREM